jgi:acylphosphatase
MNEQRDERLHAIVEGMVQGVGYRQFTFERAGRLGLTGWVRNRYDRKVETVAEGPRGALEDFLNALQAGPPAAVVRRVTANWGPATGEYASFEIR